MLCIPLLRTLRKSRVAWSPRRSWAHWRSDQASVAADWGFNRI